MYTQNIIEVPIIYMKFINLEGYSLEQEKSDNKYKP
jgi:hypothetical protein